MKIIIRNAVVVLYGLFGMIALQAQGQQAYLSVNKVMASVPGYTEAVKQVDSLTQVYKVDIQNRNKKLQLKVQELLSNYEEAQSVTDVASLQALLNDNDKSRFTLLQQESELINATLKMYNEKVQLLVGTQQRPKEQKVQELIRNYAKTHSINVIYNLDNMAQGMVYMAEGMDITTSIIKAVKTGYTEPSN